MAVCDLLLLQERGLFVRRRGGGGGVYLLLLLGVVDVAAVVLLDVHEDHAVGDADDVEEPDEVERLQRDQQGEGDDEADPALVLLRLPVELVGADGLELGEERPDDAQVDVVAQVDPDGRE